MAVTWNPSDTGGFISLTGSDLIANSVGTAQSGSVRCTDAVTGKKYFEVANTTGGLYLDCGFANASFVMGTDQLYNTTKSFSWSNDGNIYYNGGTPSFPGTYTTSDVLCWAIDEPNRKAWWRKNNGSWQPSGDPAAGTGGYTVPFSGSIIPSVELYNDSGGSALQFTLRALSSAWSYSAPSGFTALDPGAAGRTGDASITEAGDTLSGAGTIRLQAASSITEAGDTLSAAGTIRLQAASAITEADDTLSATAGAVTGRTADAAITEAGDTVSAAGVVKLKADFSVSEAGDTVASAAVVKLKAAFAVTEAGDTLSAEGTGPLAGIVASLSITEQGDTLASTARAFGWVAVPPTDETWVPVPVNDETWSPIAGSAVNWS